MRSKVRLTHITTLYEIGANIIQTRRIKGSVPLDVNQRKQWNENHKKLTNMILKPSEHENSVDLFLSQHGLLHSSKISDSRAASLEDELLKDLLEESFRTYPVTAPDTRNSIVWHIWHITRIEDMTMNILVGGGNQILHSGHWANKLNVDYPHSGNEMTQIEIADLSENMDINALMEYRSAVGRKTREIVAQLSPGSLERK